MKRAAAIAFAVAAGTVAAAEPAPATYEMRQLTPETALKAAQAALAKCRALGFFQTAVTLVDRGGIVQILLRDRFAGPHTVEVSTNKAWTALSFRTDTSELEKVSAPGQAMSGLRQVPRFTAIAGGLKIESGGVVLGGIGVSGAPGGANDEQCAHAGLAAIAEDLELR